MLFSYNLILYSIFKKSEEVTGASDSIVKACESGDVQNVIQVLNNTNMYFLIASLRKFSSKFSKMLKRSRTSRRYKNLLGFSPLISRWVRAPKLAESPRMQEDFYSCLFDDKDEYVANYLELLVIAIAERDAGWVHHVHAAAVVLRHVTARLGKTFLEAEENEGVLNRLEDAATDYVSALCSESTLNTPGGAETALWCLGYIYPYILTLISAAEFASGVVGVIQNAREDHTLHPMLARFIGNIYCPINSECVFTGRDNNIDEKGREGDESDVQNFLMGTFIETISQYFAAAGGSKEDVRAMEVAGARMLLCTPRIVSNERREEELVGLMTLAVTVATKCDVRNCTCAYGLLNFFYAGQQCPSALCIGATYFVQSLAETSLFLSCLSYIWTSLVEQLLRDPAHARYGRHHRLARNVATAIVKVVRCLVDVFIKAQGVSWRGETDIPHGSLLYLLLNLMCPEQLPPLSSILVQKQKAETTAKSTQTSPSSSVLSQKQDDEESGLCDSEDENDFDDYSGSDEEDDDDNDGYNNGERTISVDDSVDADNEISSSTLRTTSTITTSTSPLPPAPERKKRDKKKGSKKGGKKKQSKQAKKKSQEKLLDRGTMVCAMETCKDICASMTEAKAKIDPVLAEALYPRLFTLIIEEIRTKKKRSKKLRKQKAQQQQQQQQSNASRTEDVEEEVSLETDISACAAAIALCEWRGPKRNLHSLFTSSYVWLAPFVYRSHSRTGLCGNVGIASVAVFCESLLTTAKGCTLPKPEIQALERLCSMFHRHVHSFAENLRMAVVATAEGGATTLRAAWERVLMSFLCRGADPRAQRAIGLAALHSICMCAAVKGGCTIAFNDAYLRSAQYSLSWELSGQTLEAFPYLSPRTSEQHPLGQALSAFAAIGALDSCHEVMRRMKVDGLVTLAQHDVLSKQLSEQSTSGVPRIHYAVLLDGYAFPPALDGAAFVACIMPHVSFDMFTEYLRTCFGNDLTVVTSSSVELSVLKPMRRATVYRAWPKTEVQRWKTLHLHSASLYTRGNFDKNEDPFIRSAHPTTDFIAFVHDPSPRPREWTQEYEINDGPRMASEPIPHEILHSKDLPPHRDRTFVLRFQTATELPGMTTLSPAVLTTTSPVPPFKKERGCLVEMCTQWAFSKCADLRRLFDMLTLSGNAHKYYRSNSFSLSNDNTNINAVNSLNSSHNGIADGDVFNGDDTNNDNGNGGSGKNKRGYICCPVCARRFCDTNSGSGRNSDDQGPDRRPGTRRATVVGAPTVLSRSTSLSSLTTRKRAGTSEDVTLSPSSTPPLQLPSQRSQSHNNHRYRDKQQQRSQSHSLFSKDSLLSSEKKEEGNKKGIEDCCVDLADPRCGHDVLLGMVEDMLMRCGAVGIDTCIDLLAVEDARVEAMGDKVEAYSRKDYLRKSKADPSIQRPDFSSIRVCRVTEYGALREATGKLLGVAATAMLNLTRMSLLLADESRNEESDAEDEFAHHMELEERLLSLRWQFTMLQSIATATVTSQSHPAATNPLMSPPMNPISSSSSMPSQPPPPQQTFEPHQQVQQATPLSTAVSETSKVI